MPTASKPEFDYLLVGGGLGNALIALQLFVKQPQARVGLIEQGAAIGGDHIWCFHAGDVDAASHETLPKCETCGALARP